MVSGVFILAVIPLVAIVWGIGVINMRLFSMGEFTVTCTGPDGSHANHPVCQNGDLFGAVQVVL